MITNISLQVVSLRKQKVVTDGTRDTSSTHSPCYS